MALLLTLGIVHGSLHRSLAIDPLVHLAIAQPPVDTLSREICRVLPGHLVHLGSKQCGGGLFIMSSSHGGVHVVEGTSFKLKGAWCLAGYLIPVNLILPPIPCHSLQCLMQPLWWAYYLQHWAICKFLVTSSSFPPLPYCGTIFARK